MSHDIFFGSYEVKECFQPDLNEAFDVVRSAVDWGKLTSRAANTVMRAATEWPDVAYHLVDNGIADIESMIPGTILETKPGRDPAVVMWEVGRNAVMDAFSALKVAS